MTTDRILVALVEPVGGKGGMDAYDLGLAAGLEAAGAESILYTSNARQAGDQQVETPFAGVYGAAPTAWRAFRFLAAYQRSLNHARRRGAQLVHLHFFRASILERLCVRIARRSRLPIVATAHDVQSLGERDASGHTRRLYRQVDRVIVHNSFSRRELAHLAPGTTPQVIPHGNYLHRLGEPIDRRQARRRLGLPAEAPIALFFGQIKKTKGLSLLLEAMRRVATELPDAQLVIAGRAWKDEPRRYDRLCHQLGIASRVDFRHGYVPDEQVAAYLAAADLVVLPYRRVYQSGVVLLAMSHRRAVLVTDLPAMLETVDESATGFTFRAGDAAHLAARMVSLLPEKDLLERTGERAHEQVRRDNDWERIGARTLEVYRQALELAHSR